MPNLQRVLQGVSVRGSVYGQNATDMLQVLSSGQADNRRNGLQAQNQTATEKRGEEVRILRWKEQNEVFKRLVNLTVELMKYKDNKSAVDAMIDVAQIATIIGGKDMLEALEGKHNGINK